jgi:hypothetical protein
MSGIPYFLDTRLTDGDEIVGLTRRPRFTSRKIPGTHFCQRLSKPQGRTATGKIRPIEKKNPMTSLGIKPTTFWLVAQCLIQLRYATIAMKAYRYWAGSADGRRSSHFFFFQGLLSVQMRRRNLCFSCNRRIKTSLIPLCILGSTYTSLKTGQTDTAEQTCKLYMLPIYLSSLR